jgi:DNA ligase-1
LSIGCDAKTINKEIPGLIPTFDVQLANKYFDKPEYVEGKQFAITTKIDGGRIIALKENGQVSFFTRAGQVYEGLVDLESEMLRLLPDNICLDGEITLLDRGTLSSKEAYKETMKIVRTKDKEKHGIKMLVFDCMPVSDFKEQTSSFTYLQRRQMLDCMTAFNEGVTEYFELLPILYLGADTSKITEILDEEISKGEEGIMVNICDAPYEFKRTNNLLKVKKMNTMDLEVLAVEEGEGRLAGTLGAIKVRYKNGNVVKVGSGFSDEMRALIWRNPESYIGQIAEIQYFEETTNADGGESLRFPVFKDFRTDKTEADY